MKTLKKLLPAIVSAILSFVLVFSVACSKSNKPSPEPDDPDDPVISGPGINVELAAGAQETITLSAANPTATIDLTAIKVTAVSETGEQLATLTSEDYTVALYKGSEKLEENSGLGIGIYQIWVTAVNEYDKVPGYHPSNFVLVAVVDTPDSISFKSGTTTQVAAARDNMSSTWTYELTYASGNKKDLTASDVTVSGITPNIVTDAGSATVKYAESITKIENGIISAESVEKQTNVSYTITADQQTGDKTYTPAEVSFGELVDANEKQTDYTEAYDSAKMGTVTLSESEFIVSATVAHTTTDKWSVKTTNGTTADKKYSYSKVFGTQGASRTSRRAIMLQLDTSLDYTITVYAKGQDSSRLVAYYQCGAIPESAYDFGSKADHAVNTDISVGGFVPVEIEIKGTDGGFVYIGGNANIDIAYIVVTVNA